MKNNNVKKFLAKTLIMTVVVSNIGLTQLTPALAAETNAVQTQEAVVTDDDAEQETEITEDNSTQDTSTPNETTTSKVVMRLENADVKAFVDDQELVGTANEDGSVAYEVENGKTLKIQVNTQDGNTVQVTRTNNETGEEETLTPDENGFYCLDVNQDETLTFTSVTETSDDEFCYGHITEDIGMSDDSEEGFQWEKTNAQEELMGQTEEEMEDYTQEIIDEQNLAASVPVDSIEDTEDTEDTCALGSTRSTFEGLVESLCSSLASGEPSALAGWGGKTIYQLIFGSDDDQADQVSEMLDTINDKSNQISTQLNQMEYRLEEIQKGVTDIKNEQKAQNIRADLNNVTNYRINVETFLFTMKTLDQNHTGDDREQGFYQDALKRLDTETLNNIMRYGKALLTKGVNTGHSSFYDIAQLISLSDIGWESKMQEPQFYQNAQLITPYLEAVSYATVLKEYELAQLEAQNQTDSSEYRATKNDILLMKKQVGDIKEEMEKNKIQNNRPAGTIAFYLKSGEVVLLSDKVRLQTEQDNGMEYPAFKEVLNKWESMKKGSTFTDYLLGDESTLLKTRKMEAANFAIQAAIANNLATMDHGDLVGTEILRDLGFNMKYDTDTLTMLTSEISEVKTDNNSKVKSFGVHTVTLDNQNNVHKGMTYFQYTDKNGKSLGRMICDKKGFVSFMLNSVGSDNASQSGYHRYYTVPYTQS